MINKFKDGVPFEYSLQIICSGTLFTFNQTLCICLRVEFNLEKGRLLVKFVLILLISKLKHVLVSTLENHQRSDLVYLELYSNILLNQQLALIDSL